MATVRIETATAETSALHRAAIVIDGLISSGWGRPVFTAMRAGGLTAANCTSVVWEGFEAAMAAFAKWKQWFRENDDLILQVYAAADIRRAKDAGKVGIIMGWQNSTGFGDDLRYVPIFAELGLRVVQLTYNTANLAGSGCLESRDGGLTDFGRDLVAALNRDRILIDLSHVGPRTAREAIETSTRPTVYSHCGVRALKDHPRNKTDDEMRFIAARGGLVGVTMFPAFMRRGADSTLDDYLDSVEHVIGVCGEDHVGIATDFIQNETESRLEYYALDKGYGRRLSPTGELPRPADFSRLDQYPNLTRKMETRRWSGTRIRKLLGDNWLRLFGEVCG